MTGVQTCALPIYLTVTGNRWFTNKDGSRNEDRYRKRDEALDFIRRLMDADVKQIAIENPVGFISTFIRKPDQTIQPYMFGDEASKKTCLWLKNLPVLEATKMVSEGERVYYKSGKSHPKWYAEALTKAKTPQERSTLDRKSTRLNSSHGYISYAVFCLKKKKTTQNTKKKKKTQQ